jgi:hypothetical protein
MKGAEVLDYMNEYVSQEALCCMGLVVIYIIFFEKDTILKSQMEK